MSRKYHSSEQLNGELSLKKGISFTEGRPTMPTPRQSRPRSSAMVYYTDSGLTRQSANKRSHTIAGADKPGKWGSRYSYHCYITIIVLLHVYQQSITFRFNYQNHSSEWFKAFPKYLCKWESVISVNEVLTTSSNYSQHKFFMVRMC